MNKILTSDKIYIAQSQIPNAGRGVFAKKHIKKDEIIETCPVIPLSPKETADITDGALITYLYYFGEEKERSLVVLGFGAIYNHTAEPNAVYKEHETEQLMEFIALEDIKKDEEITVNYNQHTPYDKTPLWFVE